MKTSLLGISFSENPTEETYFGNDFSLDEVTHWILLPEIVKSRKDKNSLLANQINGIDVLRTNNLKAKHNSCKAEWLLYKYRKNSPTKNIPPPSIRKKLKFLSVYSARIKHNTIINVRSGMPAWCSCGRNFSN